MAGGRCSKSMAPHAVPPEHAEHGSRAVDTCAGRGSVVCETYSCFSHNQLRPCCAGRRAGSVSGLGKRISYDKEGHRQPGNQILMRRDTLPESIVLTSHTLGVLVRLRCLVKVAAHARWRLACFNDWPWPAEKERQGPKEIVCACYFHPS